jgi:transposase-like protein
MVKCPNCGAEVGTSSKEWKYGIFHAKRYDCPNCKIWFREYYYKDKLSFVLMPVKGKGIRKVTKA